MNYITSTSTLSTRLQCFISSLFAELQTFNPCPLSINEGPSPKWIFAAMNLQLLNESLLLWIFKAVSCALVARSDRILLFVHLLMFSSYMYHCLPLARLFSIFFRGRKSCTKKYEKFRVVTIMHCVIRSILRQLRKTIVRQQGI